MIDEESINKMKEYYSHVHPLIFERSLEHASDASQLFDILEAMPKELPIIWSNDENCWKNTDDIMCRGTFN